MSTATTTVISPIAARTPSPLRTAQLARDTRRRQHDLEPAPALVARPSRPGTTRPPAPRMNEPKPKNVSCRTPDGWVRSRPG